MYFYSMKITGDVIVDIVEVEDEKEFKVGVKERLIKMFESMKGFIPEHITECEDIPTRKGKKFKFKIFVKENGYLVVYKFNTWYGSRGRIDDVRVKFTIRGPLRPDANEILEYARVSGDKNILTEYGLGEVMV